MRQAILGALAVTITAITLEGCIDPGHDCWTAERIERQASRSAGPIREIREGPTEGSLLREDPKNWMTGIQDTGQECRIVVEHRDEGTWVDGSFLAEPVRLETRLGHDDSPFFVGRARGGTAVVVQHRDGEVVSLTRTRFEEDGTLSYGACGRSDTPFLECQPRAR